MSYHFFLWLKIVQWFFCDLAPTCPYLLLFFLVLLLQVSWPPPSSSQASVPQSLCTWHPFFLEHLWGSLPHLFSISPQLLPPQRGFPVLRSLGCLFNPLSSLSLSLSLIGESSTFVLVLFSFPSSPKSIFCSLLCLKGGSPLRIASAGCHCSLAPGWGWLVGALGEWRV